MAESTTLRAAVGGLVRDGDVVAMEGFTHLIPFAAGHEVIRQRKRNLTLVRMTPDAIYDQLIGAGCAARLAVAWAGPRKRTATRVRATRDVTSAALMGPGAATRLVFSWGGNPGVGSLPHENTR